jgi:predicted Zn-dependent protease
VVPAVLCLTLSGLTIWRNVAWQSDLSLWRSTLRTSPGDPFVKAMLARTLLTSGKLEEARKEVEEAIKLGQNNIVGYLTLGQIETNAKDFPKAAQAYSKALHLVVDNHLGQLFLKEAQLGLANAQVNLGQFDKAKELAMTVLLGDRNSVAGNLVMGKSLIGLKQPMLALNCLNAGYKADRMEPEYLEPIAEACLDAGADNLIRNAYGAARLALKFDPSEKVQAVYAQAALETRHFLESEKAIDSLLQLKPDNLKYMYLKSFVEKELGRGDAAEKLKKKVLLADPAIAEKIKIKILPEQSKK